MIKRLDLRDKITAEKIVQLQKASYIVEAELIDFYEIPPLLDTPETVMDCDEVFYGYYEEDVLGGLISYKQENNVLDIYRVAVHPEYFRKGIARKMVEFIMRENMSAEKVIVSTGLKNQPAINLYLKLGFKKTGEIEVAKDVFVVSFEK